MVHSTKHYVQQTIATVTGGGAVVDFDICVAVATDQKNLPNEVEEGANIKACYIEMWIRAGSTTPSSGQFILYKRPGGQASPSVGNMATLHDWINKKNILFTGQGLFNDQDADAIAVMRGWYKIPKGKQRFGLGDELVMSFFAPTIDYQICGFATYKEYT